MNLRRRKIRFSCPHCNSTLVKKNGHRIQYNLEPLRNEVLYGVTNRTLNKIDKELLLKIYGEDCAPKTKIQRFKCNSCGKTFTWTTSTIIAYTKLSLEILDRFVASMLNNDILEKTAEVCNISVYTAFLWRHKILSAITLQNDSILLCGEKVELDETYFRISYKGNGKDITSNLPATKGLKCKSNNSYIDRKAYKRGKSDPTIMIDVSVKDPKEADEAKKKLVKKQKELRGISKNKVCVITGLDHNGNYIGQVSNLARPSIESIDRVMTGHIVEGSTVYTDEMNSYIKFAEMNKLNLIQVNSKIKRKGDQTLQSTNSLHSDIERRINYVHYGFSSKYLNHYISWYMFIINKHGKLHNNLEGLRSSVFHSNCRVVRRELSKRPPISFASLNGYKPRQSYIQRLAEQALECQ